MFVLIVLYIYSDRARATQALRLFCCTPLKGHSYRTHERRMRTVCSAEEERWRRDIDSRRPEELHGAAIGVIAPNLHP